MLLPSLFRAKCPKCRKGNIFRNKSVFPLKECLEIEEYCSVCKQKVRIESNYGQGMNFVFIFIVFFINLLWYWPAFGLSLLDNSIYYYLAVTILMIIMLQPWIMRLSRVLFLYLVTGFEGNTE